MGQMDRFLRNRISLNYKKFFIVLGTVMLFAVRNDNSEIEFRLNKKRHKVHKLLVIQIINLINMIINNI